MEFTHEETGFLMRSVLRSMEKQRHDEQELSKRVYDKLSAGFVKSMDPAELRAVGLALEGFNGEYSR